MPSIVCTRCGLSYPDSGIPFKCSHCGGIYDFSAPPVFDQSAIQKNNPGIWRYQDFFNLFSNAPQVTLGEGNTPLVWDKVSGVQVGYKMESQNPTGSYKDRGTAVMVSQLLARGITEAVEDSSGNAGASFAAYSARAGIKSRIFVPASASGPKRNQIENYGAELIKVPGPRSAAADAVMEEVKRGATYASHAYLPFGLAGIATIAYELWETIGGAPGTVIMPAGHGGLMLGVMRGFSALQKSGLISKHPYYVGVQARACSPIWSAFWAAFKDPREELTAEFSGKTLAEGVAVQHPIRAEAILEAISPDAGQFLAIDEESILTAYHEMAHRGFYVEPTSALVWSAFQKVIGSVPEPIVLIISGSGLKYIPS